VAGGEYKVLLPMCDYTTIPISNHLDELRKYVLTPVPEFDALQTTRDKLRTLELAQQLGIDTPATYSIQSDEQLKSIASTMTYPCVTKLRQGAGGFGFRIFECEESLVQEYPLTAQESDFVFVREHPLIQEYVPGEIHDVCLLFNRGKVRAAVTQKRLMMYPSKGGIGILNETTDEPTIRDQAVRLLESLNWHGPAQVEFKVDSKSESPKLMEVNGRYWGTLDLCVRAGVNFPLLACEMAINGDIDTVSHYKTGLRYHWPFPYGLLHLVESGFALREIWELMRVDRHTVSDLWLTDPLPTLAEVLYIIKRVWENKGLSSRY
jgi:predicted ATP-grasp superfamily ATP-dependent carboligase